MNIFIGSNTIKQIVFVPPQILEGGVLVDQAPITLQKIAITNASGTPTVIIPSQTTFNYFYKIIDLLYVESIANDIYGLHYDLIGASTPTTTPEPDVYTQSFVYDKIDKTYSWF
jgi:hypothetical protein